jgi:hypothetical protein
MPPEGLEPTITAFERATTFHAFDRASIVIVSQNLYFRQYDRFPKTEVCSERLVFTNFNKCQKRDEGLKEKGRNERRKKSKLKEKRKKEK